MVVEITSFDKNKHDRKGFDCGEPALNKYLWEQVSQDIRNGYVRLFVAKKENEDKVLGYYTLSSASLPLQDIPEQHRKKLPKYPFVPAILLGRLAIDKTAQGQGLGSKLMGDAVVRSMDSSVAWAVMVVDAKDDNAGEFYKHFLFTPLQDDPKHLYARKADLAAVVFQKLGHGNSQDTEKDEHIKTVLLSYKDHNK